MITVRSVVLLLAFGVGARCTDRGVGVIYSERYANVHYQGVQEGGSHKSRLDLNANQQDWSEADDLEPTRNKTEAAEIDSSYKEPLSELINIGQRAAKLKDHGTEEEVMERGDAGEGMTAVNDQGVYYIYHPNGLLQKVVYAGQGNMLYSSKLQLQSAAPIVEPIYTYDPKTFVLQRLVYLNSKHIK